MSSLATVAALDPGPDGRVVRRTDPDAPVLTAFDLAATRGDGAFEAMLVRSGRPLKPERHLARLTRSLAALGFPGPTDEEWSALVDALVEGWPADTEGVLKLVVSRGQEGYAADRPPTAYGTLVPIDPLLPRQRAAGIHVVSLTYGYAAHARDEAPWLLAGVKYLSYAVHMAAKRHAASVGADDVVYLSAEGDVLEGPTSSVLWLTGTTLHTTPPSLGVLRGTTQELLFDVCDSVGLSPRETVTDLDGLRAADGVWFCSSTRGIAVVRSIDGQPLDVDDTRTAELQGLVGIPAGKDHP